MNKAIILVPDNGNDIEVTTNGVHLYTLINALHNLERGLCERLVAEAEKAVGKNPKDQEKYLDNLINQLAVNDKGRRGGDILKNKN